MLVRNAYETVPWSAQCDPKLKKKTNTLKLHMFLHKICENSWKIASKRCPNGWGNFGGGAPWGTFGAPVCFLTRKVYPKCSIWNHFWWKGLPNGAKMEPKWYPRDRKGYQSYTKPRDTMGSSKHTNKKRRAFRPVFHIFEVELPQAE